MLPPQWAIQAENAIIDFTGRLAARYGILATTTTAAPGQVRTIFEYRTPTGASMPIVGFDGGISSNLVNLTANSLVGTISSVANGRWFFQNFNSKCIGFQAGQKPIVLQNQSSTFSNIVESAGTAPTGGVGCCAYGRVWGIDADGQTLKWSALLDETNWGTGDSGSINLSQVWPNGVDQVNAIAAFNGALLIFGTRQILFYSSTTPSAIGLNVGTIELSDVIEGTGCISQFTVANIGNTDMLFLSKIGVQSIARLMIQKSRPTALVTKWVRSTLVQELSSETPINITGFYSPTQGFYALALPNTGSVWVLDVRHMFTDSEGDQVARITRWTMSVYTGVEFFNRNLYLSAYWTTGVVGQYSAGSNGDNGSLFTFTIQLPWTDFETGVEQEGFGFGIKTKIKAFKGMTARFTTTFDTTANVSWFIDFSSLSSTAALPISGDAGAAWGVAEWGNAQWGTGATLQIITRPLSGTGQYLSMQVQAQVSGTFAFQQVNILPKLLRIAYGTYT